MKIKHSIECWLWQAEQQRFLLLQCPATARHAACWQPVTGGVLAGETAVQACLREVFEETGLTLPPSALRLVLPEFRVAVPEYDAQVRKPVFTVETSMTQITISAEHRAYQWVMPDQVAGLLCWDSYRATFAAIRVLYPAQD